MPREDFRAELRDIAGRVPSLSDDGVALGLARLLARVGDGHTLAPLLWDDSLGYRRLPVELIRTSKGVSVLAAGESLTDLPGSRVRRIGNLAAEEALDSVATSISRDNAWTARYDATAYAMVPEILRGLGIAESADRVELTIEDPTGTRREIAVDAVDRDATVPWDYGAYEGAAPWLNRRDDPYWLTVLPGDAVVCVQFNRADRDKEEESVAEFGRRLLGLVKEGSVRRVVLDLRWNHGGSRWRGRHLLGALIALEHELGTARSTRARTPSGHLVTLIGPGTFSAANLFALDLELHTNTAFVGLPTGGKPNHFGEVGRFRLPESGLEIRHSVYYRQATHPRDTRPAIFPDRRVAWTAEDVVAGRDPQVEVALSWRPLPSGLEELRRRIRRDGVDPALAWLDSLVSDPSPEMRITEAEINRLGYGLLQQEQPEAAAAVFRWNLDAHPWSANAHDSLADAYLELGREQQAERLLCRAVAIDPQFDRALERGLDCGGSWAGNGEPAATVGREGMPMGDPAIQSNGEITDRGEDMSRSGSGCRRISRREAVTSLVVGAGGLLAGCRNRTEGAEDPGARSNDSNGGPIEAFVKERMAEYGIPGMSVSLVRQDRNRSFASGSNDMEFGIPASPETVYQIASVSKIFAGIAIMLLVDEGRLTVEAPVADVLPGLPRAWDGIRVHHLLEHTSGLPRGPEAAPGYESEARRRRRREIYVDEEKLDHFTAEERLDFLEELPLRSEPGSTYSYNQMGYMLVGMIVHRLSGVPYPSFLEARVFGPLGMTSARFGDSRVVVPNRRDVAYTRQYGPLQNWLWPYSTSDYPAAGLNISAPDLAKCIQALAEGRLLSDGARERMWTRARLLDGTRVDYALGWSVRELEGRTVVGHEGGGCCWLTHVPEDQTTAIALSNLAGSGADDTSDRIALLAIRRATPSAGR